VDPAASALLRHRPEALEPSLGIDRHGRPGNILISNPVLSPAETAALFEAAWGEQAPDSPPALDRCLAHVGSYDGGRLVGFVKLAWDGGDHAFVLKTIVHPDYQRRGIGRRLFERAAEIAGQSGVEWLHVDYKPALGVFMPGAASGRPRPG
jgi:GNAT superfamily N-acetyltransferase